MKKLTAERYIKRKLKKEYIYISFFNFFNFLVSLASLAPFLFSITYANSKELRG